MSNTASKTKSRFFTGMIALTFANIFVKLVGLILKVPLRNMLGDAGMIYYNNAYEIYAWLFTISTIGLPSAISMMISEDRAKGNVKEIKKIYRVSLFLFLVIGVVGTSVMFFGAPLFEQAYRIENSAYCIMAVAPTLFFICIASALRGYFQGYQNMTPTAMSEIIEAIGKMALGLLFAQYAISQGYEMHIVAAYAALGLTIGVAAGMLYLFITKLFFRPRQYDFEYAALADETMEVKNASKIVKTLLFIAIPITFANSIQSFSAMIDSMLLTRRLQEIGFAEEQVKQMVGNYKTCAVPFGNLPPAMIAPVTASILPMLTASIAAGNKSRTKKVIESSLLITAILELPCALGMSVLAEPIIKLLFGEGTGAEAAAPLLSVLSLSVFFGSMIATTSAILQAHKLERKPIVSMLVGAVVKISSVYLLVGIPSLNIQGAPITAILGAFAISAVNLYYIKKYLGYVPDFKRILLRPFAASLICALTAMVSYWGINAFFAAFLPRLTRFSVIFAIGVAMVVYFFVIFLFRAVSREDVLLLPKGQKLCRLLERMHLLPKEASISEES